MDRRGRRDPRHLPGAGRHEGLHAVAQTGLNGLSLGAIYALGAVGLTLVYGILKLVNFAQGDFLTFGAYMAYLVNVTWGAPLIVAVFWAMVATALLGLFFERLLWGPMRPSTPASCS